MQPVVLDTDGRVLDGRNRLAACKQAGVEPEFATYDGDDPDGYALAVNLSRRHLSKGQQAMVAAKAAAVTGQTQRQVASAQKLSTGRVGQARTVLDHAPDLADAVVAGATPLDTAYATARERKQASEDTETQLARGLPPADGADCTSTSRTTIGLFRCCPDGSLVAVARYRAAGRGRAAAGGPAVTDLQCTGCGSPDVELLTTYTVR